MSTYLKITNFLLLICREIADYLDPKFNHDEGTVTITPTDRMEWIPHLNSKSEDDILVMPNVVMLVSLTIMPLSKQLAFYYCILS